jgi:hypothetical protein
MLIFPWDEEKSIQQVPLAQKYRHRFDSEFGPDEWSCEFLDDLGKEIRERSFDGSHSVLPVRFSTASGHGIGKSTLVAWLIKFIHDAFPLSKGVVTANTNDQLRTKTWAELAKWHHLSLTQHWSSLSVARGSLSLSSNMVDEKNQPYAGIWRVDGQTCREENSEAFQGLHAANSVPFYIFDEASGIPEKIWLARAGGATDGFPMSFDFGNPTRNSGTFFENCIGKNAHRFNVRSIDSRSVYITNKPLMEEWIEDYGEDSDFVKVKVKGVFPSQSTVQFIDRESVELAQVRSLPFDNNAPLIIGVDVARFGDDDTVIYPRIGNDARSFPYRRFNGLDTMQVTHQIIEVINDFLRIGKKCSALFIDGGAMGAGPIDRLRQLGYNPIEVQFGSRALNNRYRFRGDEIWGNLKDGLKNLCLPIDDAIMSQLTQREYGFTHSGKIALEAKKDMKKRGVMSPDIIDALALTYSSEISYEGLSSIPTKYLTDFDPLGNF